MNPAPKSLTIKLALGIPTELTPVSSGMEVSGNYGPQMMFNLAGNQRLYVPLPVGEEIRSLSLARGASFTITKSQRDGSRSFDWIAIAPDIVAGGPKSLEFSVEWKSRLPLHWPWYLAVQDGMIPDDVRPVEHLFAGIFLGGSDKFKLQAYRWKQFATSCNKPFHYARAGTLRKLAHAHRVKADSLDSAFPLWSKERMRLFCAFFDGLGCQRDLSDDWY